MQANSPTNGNNLPLYIVMPWATAKPLSKISGGSQTKVLRYHIDVY